MNKEEFQEYNKKIRTKGIVMSRVPEKTRDIFIQFAEEEFCGDFGMCLKHLVDNMILWKTFFENTDMKQDLINEKLDSIIDKFDSPKEESTQGRKMLSGRRV